MCQTFDDEKGIDQEQYKSQIVSVCKVVRRAYSKYEQAWIFEATQEFPLVWKSVIQEHSKYQSAKYRRRPDAIEPERV